MALSDAGLQFLVAASRANVGVKSGRPASFETAGYNQLVIEMAIDGHLIE